MTIKKPKLLMLSLKILLAITIALGMVPAAAYATPAENADTETSAKASETASLTDAAATDAAATNDEALNDKTSNDVTTNDEATSAAGSNISGETAEEIVASMTLKEKIEQMIMPAMREWTKAGETKASNFTEMNDEVKEVLKNHNFAGVCLFGQNITGTEQITRLCYDIQSAVKDGGRLPYLLSCDQEGGRVARINSGVTFSGNMSLAATTDVNNAYTCGKVLGTEMRYVGMNIDFAPDVDVNVNPSNPVISTRSFSDDPSIVSNYGLRFSKGLNYVGVAGTLKHFPGHGDTDEDSHTGLPCVNKSKAELDTCELAAFKQILAAGDADCIMTAHIQFPQVETETYISKKTGDLVYLPATLSKTFLTDILQNEMGYDGVICTDAMEMKALTEHFDKLDTAELAINAGVDILLVPFDIGSTSIAAQLDEYVNQIVALVGTQISLDRINESCEKIVQLKIDRGVIGNKDTRTIEQRVADAKANVGNSDHRSTERTIADKSITVVKNENNALPLKADNQKIAVLSAQNNRTETIKQAVAELVNYGKLPASATFEYVDYEVVKGSTAADADQIAAKVLEAVQDCDQVICFTNLTGVSALAPTKTSTPAVSEPGLSSTEIDNTYGAGASVEGGITDETVISEAGIVDKALSAAHSAGKKFIQVSSYQPYDVARYNDADAVLATYNNGVLLMDEETSSSAAKGPSFAAALDVISGAFAPTGKLPLNIPKINDDYTYSTTELAYARGFGITDLTPVVPDPQPQGDTSVMAESTASTADTASVYCAVLALLLAGSALMIVRTKKSTAKLRD